MIQQLIIGFLAISGTISWGLCVFFSIKFYCEKNKPIKYTKEQLEIMNDPYYFKGTDKLIVPILNQRKELAVKRVIKEFKSAIEKDSYYFMSLTNDRIVAFAYGYGDEIYDLAIEKLKQIGFNGLSILNK